jgi:hypothetical protein
MISDIPRATSRRAKFKLRQCLPDQQLDAVFLGEDGASTFPVGENARCEVVGHANVECAIALACEDIDMPCGIGAGWKDWVTGSSPVMESGGNGLTLC